MDIYKHIEDDLNQSFSGSVKTSRSLRGDFVCDIPKEKNIDVLSHLKTKHHFDFLMDLCAVDYTDRPKRFDVVYHLYAPGTKARVRVKAQVGENETIDSAVGVWCGA